MSLPTPEAGLVIPYTYLWRHEQRKGKDEGRKIRPVVIVLVVQKAESDARRVTVAPITHAPPDATTAAIELPPRVKQALQLDGERTWIILDEVNEFIWPGYDIRPIPGLNSFSYGLIPPKLYDAVIARLLALAAARRVTEIRRD